MSQTMTAPVVNVRELPAADDRRGNPPRDHRLRPAQRDRLAQGSLPLPGAALARPPGHVRRAHPQQRLLSALHGSPRGCPAAVRPFAGLRRGVHPPPLSRSLPCRLRDSATRGPGQHRARPGAGRRPGARLQRLAGSRVAGPRRPAARFDDDRLRGPGGGGRRGAPLRA